ncbi:hypothetical protein IMSAGC009_04472 [Lachnospiraceae bacterium]|nr:hypothetical protein IMSAGC009_04472 [Lachnospiraceae bacterium]
MQKGWGLSKLVFRIIEQYGYIRCRDGKKYVFEEIRRDTRYHEMYPAVENKRLKAPLWVKVSGEWYFVELCTDTASDKAFINKLAELGNYGVKGFRVDLYGLKTQELKRMLESNGLKEAVGKINDFYYDNKWIEQTSSTCRASVTFGSEKNRRDCTYRMLEQTYHYAILEGMEVETGDKHLVLLYDEYEPKDYAKYFNEKYGKTGIPLLYAKWNKRMDYNWWLCIGRRSNLQKRLAVD